MGVRDILAPLGLVVLVLAAGLCWGPVAVLGVAGAFLAALGVEK